MSEDHPEALQGSGTSTAAWIRSSFQEDAAKRLIESRIPTSRL